ncbi:MAG: hypothetical protein JW768_04870 [Chitinispirillaceae bacterium]|nr:hypothetical protein [Chitinispirillaceae bacterium]
MSYIMVSEYLNEDESGELKTKLESAGMKPLVKRHGLPRMFGLDINYRVFVERKDLSAAHAIVQTFTTECAHKRENLKRLLESQCPVCTSTGIRRKEKVSIFDRIRFAGVTVWECKGCGGRWYT